MSTRNRFKWTIIVIIFILIVASLMSSSTFASPDEPPPCAITCEPDDCIGCFDPVILIATGGVSYQWSNGVTGNISGACDSGTYCVEVTDEYGDTSTCCKEVRVIKGPYHVDHTGSVFANSKGHTASVNNVEPDEIFTWSIEGGTIASGQGTNTITWNAPYEPGIYQIGLTITYGGVNCTYTTSRPILVQPTYMTGVVYKDDNDNEKYDYEDIGIPGALVQAKIGNSIVASTLTSDNGYYRLPGSLGTKYTLEATLFTNDECFNPDRKSWGNWSTIEGVEYAVEPLKRRDISVEYQMLNYGPMDFSWELWHEGPVFSDKPNVVLVHGIQLYFRLPFIPIGPRIGEGKLRYYPDNEFKELNNLLQMKRFGQSNIWEFEYADTKIGKRYWTHNDIPLYGNRLAEAIDTVISLNNNNLAVISHSMGGLVARYAAQNHGSVDKVVTLATGHFGFEFTRPVPIARSIPCVAQMQPGSKFLWELNNDFEHGNFKLLSIAADGDGFVSQSSASLVECNQDGSVAYDPSNTYFTVIPGKHASIKNIYDFSHDAFAEIIPFLIEGISYNPWNPSGMPYFSFRLKNPTNGQYPNVWINERRVTWPDIYRTYTRADEYYTYTLRADSSEQGQVKIEYDMGQYTYGWLTQGQSSLITEIINNQ